MRSEQCTQRYETLSKTLCQLFRSDAREENQLYTVDDQPYGEDHDNSFRVGGKRITPELLAEALRTLPEEKRNAVMLYYFHDMCDADIAKLYNIPRSTVQYRRTSSLETLKQFLEERANDDETDEW